MKRAAVMLSKKYHLYNESAQVFERERKFLFCVVCLTLRYLNNISFYLCAGSVALSRVNDTPPLDRSFM